MGDGVAERRQLGRQQRRRAAESDVGAHQPERRRAGACHPAVQDVADDPDRLAVELADPRPQGEDVEQRLGRVLMLAVSGVDDGRLAPLTDELGGAGRGMADHDRVGRVGVEGRDRVAQRLALLQRGALLLDRDHVGRKALGGEFERGAGPGARLEEDAGDRAASKGRHLLDVAAADLGEAFGPLAKALDVLPVQVGDIDQMLHQPASARSRAGAISTASVPSTSAILTLTRSSPEVGRFLPT